MSIGSLAQVTPAGPSVVFQFDPEQCEMTGGIGGWSEVSRPRDWAGTEYLGTGLRSLVFDLWLDGGQEGTQDIDTWNSVEGSITQFYVWGAPVAIGKEPPILQLNYGIYSTLRWGLNDFSTQNTLRNGAGERVQAQCSVTLLEWRSLLPGAAAADTIRASTTAAASAAAKTGGQASGNPTVSSVTVSAGDTLWDIAASKLGNAQRWTEIASLNGIRNPRLLQIGTRLKIPAK